MTSPNISRQTCRRSHWPVVAVIALTLVAYAPAMRGGFIWDDDDHVTHNLNLHWDALPADRRRLRWSGYALALLFFVAAMLSKTVACSLPAALLLLIWWKCGRLSFKATLPLAPMFVIGLALAMNTARLEVQHV